MDVLGCLTGIAAGAGVGFAAARYFLPPRKKAIVARLRALLEQLPVELIIRSRGEGRTIFANGSGSRGCGFDDGEPPSSIPDIGGQEVEPIQAAKDRRVTLRRAEVDRERKWSPRVPRRERSRRRRGEVPECDGQCCSK